MEEPAALWGPAFPGNGITWLFLGPASDGPALAIRSSDDPPHRQKGEGFPQRPLALPFPVIHSDSHLPVSHHMWLSSGDRGGNQDSERFREMSKVTQPACDGMGFARLQSTVQTLGCRFYWFVSRAGRGKRHSGVYTHPG